MVILLKSEKAPATRAQHFSKIKKIPTLEKVYVGIVVINLHPDFADSIRLWAVQRKWHHVLRVDLEETNQTKTMGKYILVVPADVEARARDNLRANIRGRGYKTRRFPNGPLVLEKDAPTTQSNFQDESKSVATVDPWEDLEQYIPHNSAQTTPRRAGAHIPPVVTQVSIEEMCRIPRDIKFNTKTPAFGLPPTSNWATPTADDGSTETIHTLRSQISKLTNEK